MPLEWLGSSFLYNLFKDILRKFQKKSPEEKIALRRKWKPIFEEKISENFARKIRSDVIIRNVKKIDEYPDAKEKKRGISPWFRVGLSGIYHRGIIVGLRFQRLVSLKGGRFRVFDHEKDSDEIKEQSLSVILAGRIPFENIESVDMEGDEYYNFPHIYCHFANKGEPYEEVAFYEENQLFPDSIPYHTKIAEFNDVRTESIQFGTKAILV